MLLMGLMTGTSMDGIDGSLLHIGDHGTLREVGHGHLRYDPWAQRMFKTTGLVVRSWMKQGGDFTGLLDAVVFDGLFREELASVLPSKIHQDDGLAQMQMLLGGASTDRVSYQQIEWLSTRLHGDLIQQLLLSMHGLSFGQIDGIGYHGQTLYHHPKKGHTIAMGDGVLLKQVCQGVPVVYRFREADVGAGGVGAPFAPIYHLAMAKHLGHVPLGMVNCGGIANITVMPSEDPFDLVAFDTGPGNGLLDRFISIKTDGRESFDCDGGYGAKGCIDDDALQALYDEGVCVDGENFLPMPPPKALDIGDLMLPRKVLNLSVQDGAATLAYFTACTLVQGIKKAIAFEKCPKQWLVAGGGFKNPVITGYFKTLMTDYLGASFSCQKSDQMGFISDAVEANIFAYLAYLKMMNQPCSFPNTTGVRMPMVGGILV